MRKDKQLIKKRIGSYYRGDGTFVQSHNRGVWIGSVVLQKRIDNIGWLEDSYTLHPDTVATLPVVFHAFNEDDLDKIIDISKNESEGKLVAPSIGITKSSKILTRFGKIVFIGNKKILETKGITVYERDAWSPTLANVPDVMYKFDPTERVQEYFSKYPRLRYLVMKGKDSPHRMKEEAKDRLNKGNMAFNIWHGDKDIHRLFSGYYTDEWDEEEDLEYFNGSDGYNDFINFLVNNSFVKIEKTPNSVSMFLKDNYKDLRGHDLYADAYGIASQKVPQSKIKKVGDRILIGNKDSIDFNEIKDKQLVSLRKLQKIPCFERKIWDIQEIGGGLLKIGTYNGFIYGLKKWGVSRAEADKHLREFGGTEGLYKEMKDIIIDIPSEYMEAKTLEPLSINAFHSVCIPEGREEVVKKLKKLKYKGEIKYYDPSKGLKVTEVYGW